VGYLKLKFMEYFCKNNWKPYASFWRFFCKRRKHYFDTSSY
jgi:hypothetical protein